MSQIELYGIRIETSQTNIHIFNSYLIKDDEEKIKILKGLFVLCPGFKEFGRTISNMLNEWKAHNILFQHHFKQERTKDVDFEIKQKLHLKIAYWFISHLFKEIV